MQRVLLIDGHNQTHLPVDVFDGQVFDKPMLTLQKESRRLLNVKSRPYYAQQTIDRNQDLLAHYSRLIIAMTERISRLESAIEAISLGYDSRLKQRLIGQYQRSLSHHASELAKTCTSRQRTTNRLRRLAV